MKKGTVDNILLSIEEKSGYQLNKITFNDGYYAMEKQVPGGTNFSIGQCCQYQVTHPGRSPKPDWIEFISNCDSNVKNPQSDYMKHFTIIMQNALTNSIAYYKGALRIKTQLEPSPHYGEPDILKALADNEPISEQQIIDTAVFFAKGVLSGAQELSEMFQELNQNK